MLDVSVDGLNPTALRTIGLARLPGFRRLVSEGMATFNARTAYELTDTLPNHTGMMTGRRVQGPWGHQVTFNEDNGSSLQQVNGGYVPGIFDVAHDAGLTTALYVGKDKFNVLERSWDADSGRPDVVGRDDGRDKIDTYLLAPSPRLLGAVTGQLQSEPAALTFLHLADPDLAGHAGGYLSGGYIDAVRRVDGYLVRLLDVVDDTPGLRRRTTVLLTADHGGRGTDHGDASQPANYTIPFFAWGAAVPAAGDLYAVNPARADPRGARVGYAGPQPIRNLDLAALTLRLLDLPWVGGVPVPGGGALALSAGGASP